MNGSSRYNVDALGEVGNLSEICIERDRQGKRDDDQFRDDEEGGLQKEVPVPQRVRVLKREDFPTLGIPTIPTYKLFEGLPRRTFFSGAAASVDDRETNRSQYRAALAGDTVNEVLTFGRHGL